jgi:hypothetical protein
MSAAPNGRKPAVVFDLDAKHAARAEARGETFHFVWGGEDFELMPMNEWPLATMDVLDTGDLKAALAGLIIGGDEALARFMSHNPNMGDLEDLFNAASAWAGVGDLPNSGRRPQLASTQT